ncbi:MAG TPA: hypothetical protein DIU15_09175, partial [Deltaproteobacteria bacterium]|nr:hypothetical protein [Deltaproteobacteria bacterium]
DSINFSGQVQNADGTELSLPVVWRTDYTDPEGLQLQIDLLDNMLADGTGTTAFARDLPAGVHIITLTATDSLGIVGQDSTTVTVSDYPPGQLDLDNDGFCPDGIDANNDGHCDDTELDPNGDCNDNDSAIHPNAQEICDGIDN